MKNGRSAIVMLMAVTVALTAIAGEYTAQPTPERQAQFLRAKDLVAAATNASATNRVALLADAQKTCDGLLWRQDDIFARSLVLHARIKFMKGEIQSALRLLDEYKVELDKATTAMITRGAQTNDTPAHEAAHLRKDIGSASAKGND